MVYWRQFGNNYQKFSQIAKELRRTIKTDARSKYPAHGEANIRKYGFIGANKTGPSSLFSPILNPLLSAKTVSPVGLQFQNAARFKHTAAEEAPELLVEILDKEIQEESAELGTQLSSEQFPGFSVETDNAEVKLSKKFGSDTVTVRFNVSSSLNEWPSAFDDNAGNPGKQEEPEQLASELISMPDFQVQITKGKTTLEVSCYYEGVDEDLEQHDSQDPHDPLFLIDEVVLYENEPKETEFSVSAEYFHEELQNSLLNYLADYGIDEAFGKNLVSFATNYEKKQYISLMKRLRKFVS